MVTFSPAKLDFLKEVANIGLGHAATALSDMLNERIDISLPKISMLSIGGLIAMKNEGLCAVKTGFQGNVKGALIILFNDKTSFWLIDKIRGQKEGTTEVYDEMSSSAIKEFTNIIGGSFLTAISDLLDYRLMPKLPEMFTGLGYKIKDEFVKSLKKEATNTIYVETDIYVDKVKLEGEIYLILANDSFEEMFKKMN